MCGICGKLNFDREAPVDSRVLKSMADSIRHRGPDDDGYYVSGPLGLGFRRLSIIDLSTGHQPICNEDGSVWVVFNGEIYNYRILREQLISKGHVFKTQTDTEVLVHLYEEHGSEFVHKLRGMFAIALWDSNSETLLLVRDRVGIKPLYYSLTEKGIIFASEVKAILADPDIRFNVNLLGVRRFLTFYYLPGEETLFENVKKLRPGCYLVVKRGRAKIVQYWDLSFEPSAIPLSAAEDQLVELLESAVGEHMVSDVPVGVLLSGGIDSTAILNFAARRSKGPLSSFTVGFSAEGVVDERPYAQLAAEAYKTEHYEITISAAEFASWLPEYVWYMEEPVCEPPAIALYYVSHLASKYVKVLLSGEGGDEAFAGYSNYRNLLILEQVKRLLGSYRGLGKQLALLANGLVRSERLRKYISLLDIPLRSYYYSRTSNPFNNFNGDTHHLLSSEFVGALSPEASIVPIGECFAAAQRFDLLNQMLYVDTKSWLPDDLLLKADKMTMANSVELRVPFLDHEVLEFAASLPPKLKVNGLRTKYLAKKALSGRIPTEIVQRRKMGFPVPYETWIRQDLKPRFEELILDREALQRGYFDSKSVRQLLSDNASSGKYSKEVFSLAVLELWHRVFNVSRRAAALRSDSEPFRRLAGTNMEGRLVGQVSNSMQ